MPDQVEQWVTELIRMNDEEDKVTEKQLKILQAAVEIFSEKGYASTSTSEIAHKAGVAEGTIFRHYRTKKELLLSIVAPMMSKLVAPFMLRDVDKLLKAEYASYGDFLRAITQNRIAFIQKHLPVVKVMLREIPFEPELQSQFKERVGKQVYERVLRIVTHFQEKGEIVDLPPSSVIRLSISVVIGYLLARFIMLPELNWNEEQDVEQMVQFMVRGLSPQSESHMDYN